MTLFGYVIRDLFRNPRRTLSSMVGVIVGVGLFSGVLFFIDGSGASMTKRAVAPLALDMQRVLTAPIGGGVGFEHKIHDASLRTGAETLVTLTVRNGSPVPAHEVVIRDRAIPPLQYVARSTAIDGTPVPDVGGRIPLFEGDAGIGLNIGTVPPLVSHRITYRVRAMQPISLTADLPVQATISTREALTPVRASAPKRPSLETLAQRVGRIPGVQASDPLVFVDLAPSSISARGTAVPGAGKLFVFDATYQAHYPSIKILSGRIEPGGALVSAETARALKVGAGDSVSLALPGRGAPLSLRVSGITDLSGARPLFVSRRVSSFEKFVYVPYTVVVDRRIYHDAVVPAYERAAAARDRAIATFPLEELDIALDRSKLNADPATAVQETLHIAAAVQGVGSDRDHLIDNISNTLLVAKGDAAIAKRMFLFLGLPGALLAAILTAYAGILLAGSQRRENALLRVRGATRKHLLSLLALRTISIAGIGSLIGTALGFASVIALLGRAVVFEASNGALLQSALLGVLGGMAVTAFALYVPGRRLITQEINRELAVMERRTVPVWRRFHLDLAALVVAGAAQVVAIKFVATHIPAGSVYEGQSVSLPLYLLGPPIVAWFAGTLLVSRIFQETSAHLAAKRSAPRFEHLLPGVLWRSIARRLSSVTGGALTVGLVVGLGTMLVSFSTVYDQAKVADTRFLVGSDIRLTPNPTSGAPHPLTLANELRVDGVAGATPVVFSPQNSVLTSAANEDVATLAAIDPATYPKVAALEDSSFVNATAAQTMSALQQHPDGVLVNKVLADGLKLKVGNNAKVLFGRGTDRQTRASVKVIGLFTRFPGAPKETDVVANLSTYQRVTHLDQADYYLVATADRSPAGLHRAVRALSALPEFGRKFNVETTAATFDKDQSSLTGLNVRGLLHLDSFFTFLMAATATAMFVFGLLLQRRREYVTMRAQGLHGWEIRRLVLAESGISATLGTAIGLVVGVVTASQFVHVLRPIFTLPPILRIPTPELSVLVALVLGATVVSSGAAALLIARLKPTELLRDE